MDVREEDNVCIVCWREIHVYAIGLCDHPVCHECSTRMRVLCRKSECPICRRNLPKVLFVKECRPFEELNKRLYPVDARPQICFEDDSVRQAYRELLENRCKYCPPPEEGGKRAVFANFAMLRCHVRKDHNRAYCDLCVDHLKIFPSERTAYSKRDMSRHQSQGDVEDTSHKGHPLCKFCETRYFDNDELYRHLRKDHYYCHFCGDDYRLQYYRNYEYLRAHFREEHFLCEEGDCRNETFTAAFRSDIDLKAHRAQHHNRSLTKAQAKQARTLDLEFAVAPRASANNTHASGHYYDDSGQPSGGRRQPRQPRPSRGQPDGGRDEPGSLYGSSSQNSSLTWELPPPVDYQCEKEFPQLGSDSASAAGPVPSSTSQTRAAPFPVASSYPPRRPNRVDVNSVDDFPSLNPSTAPALSTAPSRSSTLVSLRKTAKPQSNGVPAGRGVAAKQQQDANNNATGKKSTATLAAEASTKSAKSQTTVSAVLSARPAPKPQLATESKLGTKKVFEEDFPSLATRPIARLSVAPSLPPASQSEPPWSMAKSKTKKKKKGDDGKQSGSLLQTSSSTEINNNHSSADVSTGVSTTSIKKPPGEAAPVASCPTNNLLQLISAARKGVANKPAPPPNAGMGSESDDSDEAHAAPVPVLTPVDFPCLNGRSGGRTAAPPPGFSKPKPPPGFMRVVGGPDGTMGLSLASVTPAPTTAAAAAPPRYMQPANFHQRNLKLIQDVQRMLADHSSEECRFAKFKSLSGAFRQGAVTADEYFKRCVELFGSEKEFCLIFPELLFLLPDIPKQQQLMATFNAHRRALATTAGALPKVSNVQLLVCATCQQVLSAEDFRSHRTLHDPA